MLEQFEEARSIRRKTRKGGISSIGNEENCVCKKAIIDREVKETLTAIDFAYTEAEKCNLKLKELEKNLKEILYNSEMDLEEKTLKVTEIRAQQDNCEFIRKQAVLRWARLTDKKAALEKELREVEVSE